MKTGIPYSFLRNNWYLENEVPSIQGVLVGAPWVASAGNGKVGWALQQDYAEALQRYFLVKDMKIQFTSFPGKSLTQEEFVSVLGGVLGKEVTVQQVDDATYAGIMKKAGIPDFVIPILADIQKSIREGTLDFESNDFEKVLGRPAIPLSEALSQIISQISQTFNIPQSRHS